MDLGLIIYISCSVVIVVGCYLWISLQHTREVSKWKTLYSKEALLRHAEKTYDK